MLDCPLNTLFKKQVSVMRKFIALEVFSFVLISIVTDSETERGMTLPTVS